MLSALPAERTWPEGIRWEEFCYGMVESSAEVRFLGPKELKEATLFPRGVVFGPRAELRWMLRAGGRYHFVYLSDDGLPLCNNAPHKSDLQPIGDSDLPQQMFLWNASDGRIPRTPSYPCPAPDTDHRLAISVRHYKLVRPAFPGTELETEPPASGTPSSQTETILFRCVDIVQVKTGGRG